MKKEIEPKLAEIVIVQQQSSLLYSSCLSFVLKDEICSYSNDNKEDSFLL